MKATPQFPLVKDGRQVHELAEEWVDNVADEFQTKTIREYRKRLNRCPICGRALKKTPSEDLDAPIVYTITCPFTEYVWEKDAPR